MDEQNLKKQDYSFDDNLELIKKARHGDKSALDTLISLNLPLV